MTFESHAHFEDSAFDEDREQLLQKIHSGLIETIVDVGSTLESSRQALELAKTHDYIYAAVGIHPEEIKDFGKTIKKEKNIANIEYILSELDKPREYPTTKYEVLTSLTMLHKVWPDLFEECMVKKS